MASNDQSADNVLLQGFAATMLSSALFVGAASLFLF